MTRERKREGERESETGLRFLSNYLPFASCQPRSLSTSAICPRDSHHLSLPPLLSPPDFRPTFRVLPDVWFRFSSLGTSTPLPCFRFSLIFFRSLSRSLAHFFPELETIAEIHSPARRHSVLYLSTLLFFFLFFFFFSLFFWSSLLPVGWFRRLENSESRQRVSRTLRLQLLN